MKTKICMTIFSATVFSLSAQAALYDRGNGMIYDDAKDVTWLQDANYAQTSGYDADGLMTWSEANAWADQLVYEGFDSWRLTSTGPVQVEAVGLIISEMGHLFYADLGNTSGWQSDWECYTGPELCLKNTSFVDGDSGLTVDFQNVQSYSYWYVEENTTNTQLAWRFNTASGYQGAELSKFENNYAWAVHDGDISAVPVPAAAWLFGSALIGLFGLNRKNKLLKK